jgi:hypothetical protein
MKKNDPIYFWERNIHGAIVIYGELGIRQYYYYKINEAKRLYKEEYQKTHFISS